MDKKETGGVKTLLQQTKKGVRQVRNKECHPENLLRTRNMHEMLVTALVTTENVLPIVVNSLKFTSKVKNTYH